MGWEERGRKELHTCQLLKEAVAILTVPRCHRKNYWEPEMLLLRHRLLSGVNTIYVHWALWVPVGEKWNSRMVSWLLRGLAKRKTESVWVQSRCGDRVRNAYHFRSEFDSEERIHQWEKTPTWTIKFRGVEDIMNLSLLFISNSKSTFQILVVFIKIFIIVTGNV